VGEGNAEREYAAMFLRGALKKTPENESKCSKGQQKTRDTMPAAANSRNATQLRLRHFKNIHRMFLKPNDALN
jgi:hypothetical protein